MPPAPRFYLGVHRPHWLALSDQPLFVSYSTLGKVRRLPRARAPVHGSSAQDSAAHIRAVMTMEGTHD
jgi:hypothetical protein